MAKQTLKSLIARELRSGNKLKVSDPLSSEELLILLENILEWMEAADVGGHWQAIIAYRVNKAKKNLLSKGS